MCIQPAEMTTIIANPDVFRKKIIERLEPLVPDEVFAWNLEMGVFNYAVREAAAKKTMKKWENPLFVQIYKDRLRSIHANLGAPDVAARIAAGRLTAQELAFATHQDMAPDVWRPMIDAKLKRDASKYVNDTCANTDMFTCGKCKSTSCFYYEQQTRSADEPMTMFVSCLSCGKNWKQ